MAQLQSMSDAPGTLREYETIYILSPNTLNDKVGEVNDRVKGIIEERGGKVLKVDNWGKRRLAYEIKAERKGIYLYWQYLGNPDIVAEFERNMRMLDSVMRYMTVKIDEDVDPGARPTEVNDETFEAAANTAADEEDIMLGADTAGEPEAGEAVEGETAEAAGADETAASSEAASSEAASSEAAPEESASSEAAPEEASAEAGDADTATPDDDSETKA